MYKSRYRASARTKLRPFWPVARRPTTYKFSRYTPVCYVASQTSATTSPTFVGTNFIGGTTWSQDRGIANIQQGGASMCFMLTDVVSSTEFTSLFDNYRILGVELELIWNSTSTYADSSGSPVGSQPMLYWASDFDDNNAPNTPGILLEKDNTRTLALGDGKVHRIRIPFPRVADAVYNGAVFNGYGHGTVGQWLDSASPSVPHYGLKLWFEGFPVTTTPGACCLTMRRKYWIECKEVI